MYQLSSFYSIHFSKYQLCAQLGVRELISYTACDVPRQTDGLSSHEGADSGAGYQCGVHVLLNMEHVAATGRIASASTWSSSDVAQRRDEYCRMKSEADPDQWAYLPTHLFPNIPGVTPCCIARLSSSSGLGGETFVDPPMTTEPADLPEELSIQLLWPDGVWYRAQVIRKRQGSRFLVSYPDSNSESVVTLFPIGAADALPFKVTSHFATQLSFLRDPDYSPETKAAVHHLI
jgi:hypothetical protein